MDTVIHGCEELSVPLALEKSCIEFLGIEIDTTAGVLRLPQEKLDRLQTTLRQWARCKACRRKELESIIGVLQHTATVVRPGRSFMGRMIDLLRFRRRKHRFIRLNRQFRAGGWCSRGSGTAWPSFVHPPLHFVEFASDASGTWGCGAWYHSKWLQLRWPQSSDERHISFKELVEALLAVVAWGPLWRGKNVRGLCDNQAAVQVVTSRTCRDKPLMHLLRCLFFLEAHFQCSLVLAHIPGVQNALADDLNRLSYFLSKATSPELHPSPVDPALVELLDWTSWRWTQQSSNIARKA